MTITAILRSALTKPPALPVQNPLRKITLVAEAFTKPCVADPNKCLCASRVTAPAAQWFLEQLAQSPRRVMRQELQSPVGRMTLNQLLTQVGLADRVQIRQCVGNLPKFPALKVENAPESPLERLEREQEAVVVQNQVAFYFGDANDFQLREEPVVL